MIDAQGKILHNSKSGLRRLRLPGSNRIVAHGSPHFNLRVQQAWPVSPLRHLPAAHAVPAAHICCILELNLGCTAPITQCPTLYPHRSGLLGCRAGGYANSPAPTTNLGHAPRTVYDEASVSTWICSGRCTMGPLFRLKDTAKRHPL